MKQFYNMQKCLICNSSKATKTNSHIIPSFLIAMVASYDQSYKRGKELMFRIAPHEVKIYTGSLPDTEYERIFDTDKLTDERIKNELSKNDVALDYIFCPACENKLSIYLETPYSSELLHNGKSDPTTPLFFWISVIWRMSIVKKNGFELPQNQEERLQHLLKTFFELKDKKENISPLCAIADFNYRILYCKDYCKKDNGIIYGQYDRYINVLTVMIGDVCICITFNKRELSDDYKFFSLENFFRTAPVNNGKEKEAKFAVKQDDYRNSIKQLVHYGVQIKLKEESELLNCLWSTCVCPGEMPLAMKKLFIEILYDNNVKLGEKHTRQRYVDIFNYLMEHQDLWHK